MSELDEIIDGGYCVGCGACTSVSKGQIGVVENKYRQYQADLSRVSDESVIKDALAVCPFSSKEPNEDQISRQVFNYSEGHYADVIGYYRSLHAGFVEEGEYRDKCNSGGIITWMLTQLLENDCVDAVIHVKKSSTPGALFEYGISTNSSEVLLGAKSRYYPVEISKVMEYVRGHDLRYVFVGLPCFVKAFRRIAGIDPVIKARIKYSIGLVCGHLKTKAFADLFAWQAGIAPSDLVDIDFRVKMEERSANAYGVKLTDQNGQEVLLQSKDCYGANWGHNFFKYEACDYCDDVFAETADMVVGDAWLAQYIHDSQGNSVVITRNEDLERILSYAIKDGRLKLDILSEKDICRSQSGGIRHRRNGLQYRLYLKKRKQLWVPDKRVIPSANGMSYLRKLIYTSRMYLRRVAGDSWVKAVEEGEYEVFVRATGNRIKIYDFLVKVNRKIERVLAGRG